MLCLFHPVVRRLYVGHHTHTHTHITSETTVEKEKTALQVEGRKGYKKEPGAPHLGPIRSVMFLATIYKTDGTKLDEPDSFF